MDQTEAMLWSALTGGVCAVVSATVSAALTSRWRGRAAMRTADAEIQKSINEGFEKLTREMRAELTVAKNHIVILRQACRDLMQHIRSLETLLRKKGVEVPHDHEKYPGGLALALSFQVDEMDDPEGIQVFNQKEAPQ